MAVHQMVNEQAKKDRCSYSLRKLSTGLAKAARIL